MAASLPEDDLDHPFPDPPAPGTAPEVLPGLRWVRLSLPYKLDHVNCWALEGDQGWTLVDTGVAGGRTRSAWEGLLAGPMAGKGVERVVATHFHPDHIGLAGWMVERWGAEFRTSMAEWLLARMLSVDSTEAPMAESVAFYRRAGLAEGEAAAIAGNGGAYAKAVTAPPTRFVRMKAGDQVDLGRRRWDVITGGGHSPEHVCLHCPADGVLLAGDQVLPRISPNVSVWASEPEADPLAEFLAALARLRSLPEDTLVLPAHGLPFRGLHLRLAALAAHHADRLEETAAACAAEPRSVAEVTRMMFARALDPHQTMFAVGEALAHLNHLAASGRLVRRLGDDGVLRFARG